MKLRDWTPWIALAVLAGSMFAAHAWAAESFGAGWVPKPLTATQPVPQPSAPLPTADATDAAAAARLEEQLKPVAPFVSAIEAALSLHSPAEKTLSSRLDGLQSVLFGAKIYSTAGDLLVRLAELFPKEAAAARQALAAQLAQPEAPKMDSPAVSQPKASSSPSPSVTAAPKRAKKPGRWWQGNWQDDWADDGFAWNMLMTREGGLSRAGMAWLESVRSQRF